MGYTHYFRFSPSPFGKTRATEKQYKKALIECAKIIKHYSKKNGGLSGYTAHAPIGEYGGLEVNGSERTGACEPLVLREHFSENEGFNFVKTAQYEYDTVVTACLILLKHRLKDLIEVSSDGDADDWKDGLRLAKEVLKLKSLKIPLRDESENE